MVTQSAGRVAGNVGFTNIDGKAEFYIKNPPMNVYMSIKGKDMQVEIYYPGIDQVLDLSLIHNQMKEICLLIAISLRWAPAATYKDLILRNALLGIVGRFGGLQSL